MNITVNGRTLPVRFFVVRPPEMDSMTYTNLDGSTTTIATRLPHGQITITAYANQYHEFADSYMEMIASTYDTVYTLGNLSLFSVGWGEPLDHASNYSLEVELIYAYRVINVDFLPKIIPLPLQKLDWRQAGF